MLSIRIHRVCSMKKIIIICVLLLFPALFLSVHAAGKIGDDGCFWYYFQNSADQIKNKRPLECYPEKFSSGDSFSCVMDYMDNDYNDQEILLVVLNNTFSSNSLGVDRVILTIPPWYLGTDNPYGDQVLRAAAQMTAVLLGLDSTKVTKDYLDKNRSYHNDVRYYVAFEGMEGCEVVREDDLSYTVSCTYPYTKFSELKNR